MTDKDKEVPDKSDLCDAYVQMTTSNAWPCSSCKQYFPSFPLVCDDCQIARERRGAERMFVAVINVGEDYSDCVNWEDLCWQEYERLVKEDQGK